MRGKKIACKKTEGKKKHTKNNDNQNNNKRKKRIGLTMECKENCDMKIIYIFNVSIY